MSTIDIERLDSMAKHLAPVIRKAIDHQLQPLKDRIAELEKATENLASRVRGCESSTEGGAS